MTSTREIVFDRNSGKLEPLGEGNPPRLQSSQLEWKGYHLEHHKMPSVEGRELIWLSHAIFLMLDGEVSLQRREGGNTVTTRILPGQVSIIPWKTQTLNGTDAPADFLSLAIDPTFISMSCPELAEAGQIELTQQYGIDDPFIRGVLLALMEEVETGGKRGRVYSDSLMTSLAVHLVAKYSTNPVKMSGNTQDVASPRAVRKAIRFINEHLNEDFSLRDLATAAGLSPFHFTRVFKQNVGVSPHQFVLKQRIERAKQLLLRGEMSTASVAQEVGFCDQSHFSKHFKRLCGMTPRQFVSNVRQA